MQLCMGLLSKARVGVKKADIWAGKKILKSKTGLMNNISSHGKIVQHADAKIKKENSELYNLIVNGCTKVNNSCKSSEIKKMQEKFEKLMSDDKYSFSYAGYDGVTYKREMIDPAVNFPEISSLITDEVIKTVEGYYSNGCFTIEHIACGKNFYVPENIRKNHEMFSNFWHFDFNKISEVKYFVYMSDVTEKDGPFHTLTKSRTKEIIEKGFNNRNDYNMPIEILEDPEHLTKMTGPTGTAFLGHPAVVLHRAGDPEVGRYRNMIQFLFQPSNEKLPKNWIKNVKSHKSQNHKYIPETK